MHSSTLPLGINPFVVNNNNNKIYLPEALKLFAVPKVSEDLSCSDATTTEDDSDNTSEEISN